MGHTPMVRSAGKVTGLRANRLSRSKGAVTKEDVHMKLIKSQAFRALLAISALASSALVLEAGRRWGL